MQAQLYKWNNNYPLLALFMCLGYLGPNIGCAQDTPNFEAKYPLIPRPKKIVYQEGELEVASFTLEGDLSEETNQFSEFLLQRKIKNNPSGTRFSFSIDSSLELGEEGYALQIDSMVTLKGQSITGLFYGLQSLRQLFRNKGSFGVFPQVDIVDWPSFAIRGFMHDTGRNFQSVEQLKEQIEILANYKYNVFHWHLTDNPAWRLESKKFPQLQSEKAFSRDVGQYYTQEDFKEILDYCADRKIVVIPEFDIPGHTASFRRAFGIKTMKDPKVLPILLELFDELLGLADSDKMPYIHIGTDEVREQNEMVEIEVIKKIMERIRKGGRKVIVWKEGIEIEGDTSSIQQLWAQHPPSKGHRFIDSRANYINHLDPLAGMVRLFFQQPGRQPEGDSLALGGILCAWPDNDVALERDILRQNPIYPAILFYSDAIWNGKKRNYKNYWAKLPSQGTAEMQEFQRFEEMVLVHRDQFFNGKEFPYVRQSHIPWFLLGPLDHKNDFSKKFPIEDKIKKQYVIDGETFQWKGPYFGGTVYLKHFFGFPSITKVEDGTFYASTQIYSPNAREQDFWIGFQGWSRSGGRRGGPFPIDGQWHTTESIVWVNGEIIKPPKWQQPGLGVKTDEIPFSDEDYFYRKPTTITLKKGWNTLLLKIPQGKPSWKWMFTCIPVEKTPLGMREADGLIFATEPNLK